MTVDKARPRYLAAGKPAESKDLLLERRYRLTLPWLKGRGGVLLDFGCGNGAQTLYFSSHFQRIIGIDIDGDHLAGFRAAADERGVAEKLTTYISSGDDVPCATAEADVVMTFEVLEHVGDEARTLRELRRVLKPGGILVLSVPNRWWLFETHGARLPLLRWNRVPFFSWLPRRIHDRWARARIYRRREIVASVSAAGFDVLASSYVTAPMDVMPEGAVRRALRATVFRPDATSFPFLATAVLLVATPRQLG